MIEPRNDLIYRPAVVEDLDRVLAIEKGSFPDAWTRDDFCRLLRRCIVLVAQTRYHWAAMPQIVGFVVHSDSGPRHTERGQWLYLMRLAVAAEARRHGVGSSLVCQATRRADRKGWMTRAIVPETNVPGQLLLRANGFRCEEIVPDFFLQGVAGYEFLRAAEPQTFRAANRADRAALGR